MEKREQINKILKCICKNKSEFCRKTSIAASTLASWIERDTFDPFRIAEAFPQISAEWLLRGEGEMFSTNIKETKPQSKPKEEHTITTIPLSVLTLLEEQLRQKDDQINALMEQYKNNH